MNNEKKNIFFDLYNMLKPFYKKKGSFYSNFKNINFCSTQAIQKLCNYTLLLKPKQLYRKLLEHVLVSKLSDERYQQGGEL